MTIASIHTPAEDARASKLVQLAGGGRLSYLAATWRTRGSGSSYCAWADGTTWRYANRALTHSSASRGEHAQTYSAADPTCHEQDARGLCLC